MAKRTMSAIARKDIFFNVLCVCGCYFPVCKGTKKKDFLLYVKEKCYLCRQKQTLHTMNKKQNIKALCIAAAMLLSGFCAHAQELEVSAYFNGVVPVG